MKTLALETSAKSVSVAVTEDGKVLASSYQNIGLTHSVTLMPLLDGMLQNAGLTLKDMDLLAVAAGPGSFTGLRIGVSALKGLAWAEDKPCCGVSTLEAMAQNGRLFTGTVVCAAAGRRPQAGPGGRRAAVLRLPEQPRYCLPTGAGEWAVSVRRGGCPGSGGHGPAGRDRQRAGLGAHLPATFAGGAREACQGAENHGGVTDRTGFIYIGAGRNPPAGFAAL